MAVRDRFRLRRKEQKISQQALSEKADVSLGSLKRFESSGEISLTSLIKLAFALGYEGDFDSLLAQKHYRSIDMQGRSTNKLGETQRRQNCTVWNLYVQSCCHKKIQGFKVQEVTICRVTS
jgi:transcriptional regulator with XRE-family HTH domain